jgi:hypothetical protein
VRVSEDNPVDVLANRVIAEWEAHDKPSAKDIELWSVRTEGVDRLPANTIRDWLARRTVPRTWDQLHILLKYFGVGRVTDWQTLWRAADAARKDNPKPEPEPAVRRNPWWIVATGLLVAGIGVGFPLSNMFEEESETVPVRDSPCRFVVRYHVVEAGTVVNSLGQGFAAVARGDRFVHDPWLEEQELDGRLHGTVDGRGIVGYVSTQKLVADGRSEVCS